MATVLQLDSALRTCVEHIEHMAKFIADRKLGYSFESLGEDMPDIRTLLDGDPFSRACLSPGEQQSQAQRCACRGADDLCPCQNEPDRVTRTERRSAAGRKPDRASAEVGRPSGGPASGSERGGP